MTEIIKYLFVFFLILTSCNKYDEVLTRYENKLHTTEMIKKYLISKNDKYYNREDYSEAILYDNKKTTISLVNAEKENNRIIRNAVYTFWNNNNKTENAKYYFEGGERGGKEKAVHEDIEAFLKNDDRNFEFSPWIFYISKKSVHRYSKSVLENRYGYQWYIFSGKLHLKEKDFPGFAVESDRSILFEIWIRQDENVWLEFYKNSNNEIKAAIEGTSNYRTMISRLKNLKTWPKLRKLFINLSGVRLYTERIF